MRNPWPEPDYRRNNYTIAIAMPTLGRQEDCGASCRCEVSRFGAASSGMSPERRGESPHQASHPADAPWTWGSETRVRKTEREINANLCVMPWLVIVLSDALADFARKIPRTLINRWIIVPIAAKDVDPQGPFLEVAGFSCQRTSTTWRRRLGYRCCYEIRNSPKCAQAAGG